MALPTKETVQKLLASGYGVRNRILRIASRLEALNEYGPEQALMIAADIVAHSLKPKSSSLKKNSQEEAVGGASIA